MNTGFRGGKKPKNEITFLTSTTSIPSYDYYLNNWYNDCISVRMCSCSHCYKDDKLPKEYFITTKKKTGCKSVTLKWNDDTITSVTNSKDDNFDVRYGFLIAYFQKHCGMSKTKANKYLDNLEKEKEIK